MHVARQLLGGHASNGFLRATANAQRIKKQRGRQVASAQAKREAAAAAGIEASGSVSSLGISASITIPLSAESGAGVGQAGDALVDAVGSGTGSGCAIADGKKKDKAKEDAKVESEAEEALKLETMNPRTAKKLRAELMSAKAFCEELAETVKSILAEMDSFDDVRAGASNSASQDVRAGARNSASQDVRAGARNSASQAPPLGTPISSSIFRRRPYSGQQWSWIIDAPAVSPPSPQHQQCCRFLGGFEASGVAAEQSHIKRVVDWVESW